MKCTPPAIYPRQKEHDDIHQNIHSQSQCIVIQGTAQQSEIVQESKLTNILHLHGLKSSHSFQN